MRDHSRPYKLGDSGIAPAPKKLYPAGSRAAVKVIKMRNDSMKGLRLKVVDANGFDWWIACYDLYRGAE